MTGSTASIRFSRARALAWALALLLAATGATADEFDDLLSGGDSEEEEDAGPSLTFDFSGEAQIRFFHDTKKDNEFEDLAQLRSTVMAQGVFGLSKTCRY